MTASGNNIAIICSEIEIQEFISWMLTKSRENITYNLKKKNLREFLEAKHTGTAQKGIVLSFNGYLRSVIIPSPTKRWNGSIIFKTASMITRSKRINQSCICILATLAPCDLIVCTPNWISGIFLLQMTKRKVSRNYVKN